MIITIWGPHLFLIIMLITSLVSTTRQISNVTWIQIVSILGIMLPVKPPLCDHPKDKKSKTQVMSAC